MFREIRFYDDYTDAVASPWWMFGEAFRLMQESASPALPVVDRVGRLLGLITPENIGEMMLVNSLRLRDGRPAWHGARVAT